VGKGVNDMTLSLKMEIGMGDVRLHLGMEEYGRRILRIRRCTGSAGTGITMGKWVMFGE
jgi:hypothetical protein